MPAKKSHNIDMTFKHRHIGLALAEQRPGVDSHQLLCDLIEVWGGTRQLACDIQKEFIKAPSGGMTRQRILEMLQRLIITNTTHEIGKVSNPADATDEELILELNLHIAKVSQHDPGPAPTDQSAG